MRIGVAMDADGHFRVAQYDQRKNLLSVIQSIDDGDYFEDIIRNYAKKFNISTDNPKAAWDEFVYSLNDDAWFVFLTYFTQRGTFEILDI